MTEAPSSAAASVEQLAATAARAAMTRARRLPSKWDLVGFAFILLCLQHEGISLPSWLAGIIHG